MKEMVDELRDAVAQLEASGYTARSATLRKAADTIERLEATLREAVHLGEFQLCKVPPGFSLPEYEVVVSSYSALETSVPNLAAWLKENSNDRPTRSL